MADKQILLTQSGLEKLENELNELKTVKRSEIADKIKVALSFGDLSENSEYDEAKNEQGILEARIAEIEKTLQHVVIVDESELSTDTVNVGNVVRLKNMKTKEELTVTLVGSNEINIREMKISDESPIGKAIIGHKIGQTVEAEAPVGTLKFKILEITK
ncbi:MAG: transcription elongation factor GreA [Oscillospiraceae bacterium]